MTDAARYGEISCPRAGDLMLVVAGKSPKPKTSNPSIYAYIPLIIAYIDKINTKKN